MPAAPLPVARPLPPFSGEGKEGGRKGKEEGGGEGGGPKGERGRGRCMRVEKMQTMCWQY